MATISENLQTLIDIKSDIKTAIINKGVDVADSDAFDTYASKISSIPLTVEGGDGFDFSVIGYTSTDSTNTNNKIEEDIAYSKTLLDAWNPSTTTANQLYYHNHKLVFAPAINTSKVTDMFCMFAGCSALQSIPKLNTSNVTTMNSMFSGCESLTTIPQLNTSKVTDMDSMFHICNKLTTIPLLDTSKVTDMSYMFMYCSSLTTIPQLNTSNVIVMYNMFDECSSLQSIPLLDTSKVGDMSDMFSGCKSLTTIPELNTSNVTKMYGMFRGCSSLTTIPLLDASKVTNAYYMFYGCTSLTYIVGLKDLGKAFDSSSSETLDISAPSLLSAASVVSVFNNLYDLTTKTYTGTATVKIPSNVLLSESELEIATNKGWVVSQ